MRKVLKNKRILKNCHIGSMLALQAKKRHVSFHTPGHKQKGWDITELSFSDNLSSPHGCIARAQEDIARILGANKSFILTDGSTAGVLSMLLSAKTLGITRIAVCENSHKSVFNGMSLLRLTPTVLHKRTKDGIPAPVCVEDFQGIEADAILLTSPDYYGNIPDLEAIRAYCDRTGKLLLVDGAHGGHLHFDKRLYAGTYADLWVDGVHKSLPAFTQGAIVSARTEALASALERAVDVFRTTSPSYPIMASVEYAVKYPANEPLARMATEWEKTCDRLYFGGDWTKLCALFGENANTVHALLQRDGIFAEFCDGNVVNFYLSPATKKGDFLRLKKRLCSLFEKFPYTRVEDVPTPVLLQKNGETEWIPLEKSIGQVCAENCGLFPPCTPLLRKGERITQEKVRLLQEADNVFGLQENKISVFTKQNEE
ncbi:MAG: hypothetical protein E7368_01355 [Clostridiales bacterium]|nr:hypothetical protein [Clostridiales bacterium]